MVIPSINAMHLHVMHLQDASSMFLAQKGSNFTLCEIWDSPAHGLRHAMMQAVCSLSFQTDWHTACNMAMSQAVCTAHFGQMGTRLVAWHVPSRVFLPFMVDWDTACIRACAKPCAIFRMPKTCILKCNTCTKYPQP